MALSASHLVVHDDAIRANVRTFRDLTAGRLMGVLKADAFGHGEIAQAVVDEGAAWLGVATLDEALHLRGAGITGPVLSWLNPTDADFAEAITSGIDLAVPSTEHLGAIAAAASVTSSAARVHLHIDVGMGRDGCAPADWAALCELAHLYERAGTIEVVGIMGHLSCADTPESGVNIRERMLFTNAVRTARRRMLRPLLLHLGATAATLHGLVPDADLARVGAGLFGIDPSRRTSGLLQPALSLETKVVSARRVSAGTAVGYGHDFVAPAPTSLALLPIGYGDGLPRTASGRAEVFVRGRRRPLVGRCSMDMVVVDTGDDLLTPNEHVTIFGTGNDGAPTVADWAGWADTIEHDIVTRIGNTLPRLHRVHTSVTIGAAA